MSIELDPLHKFSDKITKQIEHIKEQMNTVIDLMNDSALSLDKKPLKDRLVSHQEDLNERNIQLEEITKQIRFKESQTSIDIIKFCAENFITFMKQLQTLKKTAIELFNQGNPCI